MTTFRQVKSLVRPLLARNPDLVLVGRMIAVKPIRHMLRYIYIDATGEQMRFRPWCVAVPLYNRMDEIRLGPGRELFRTNRTGQPCFWLLSDNDVSQDLMEILEQDALAQLRKILSLPDLLAFGIAESDSRPKYLRGKRIWSHIATGDFSKVRDLLAEDWGHPEVGGDVHVGRLNARCPGLGTRLLERGPDISADDRAELARILHEDEAFSVEHLKIGHIWERTPFPLERQDQPRWA
jgi:hypothetical protein